MSKFTRKAIILSFMELIQEKSLDKITVKDIIEMAEINRNTFYYYFQDIYDLIENVFMDELEKFKNDFNPKNSFQDEYIRLAHFFYEHKDFVIHLYHSKSRDVLHRYLETATDRFVAYYVEKAAKGTSLSEKGKEYIVHFYNYVIIGVTMRWVENEMADWSEDLIRTISISFEVTIDDMIQSYIGEHPSECK